MPEREVPKGKSDDTTMCQVRTKLQNQGKLGKEEGNSDMLLEERVEGGNESERDLNLIH